MSTCLAIVNLHLQPPLPSHLVHCFSYALGMSGVPGPCASSFWLGGFEITSGSPCWYPYVVLSNYLLVLLTLNIFLLKEGNLGIVQKNSRHVKILDHIKLLEAFADLHFRPLHPPSLAGTH
jgi:hypothetical protein